MAHGPSLSKSLGVCWGWWSLEELLHFQWFGLPSNQAIYLVFGNDANLEWSQMPVHLCGVFLNLGLADNHDRLDDVAGLQLRCPGLGQVVSLYRQSLPVLFPELTPMGWLE